MTTTTANAPIVEADEKARRPAGKMITLGTHVDTPNLIYHPDALHKWMKGEDFAPLYVELSPTAACNQSCFFCYIEEIRNAISIEPGLLVKIVADMADAGVKSCEFQGTGEPLVNKGTPDAVVAGRERGMAITMVTNGVLASRDVLEKITPCLSFLRFSTLEPNAQIYAKSHSSPEDHFGKVLKAIENAVRIKHRDKLDTVIVGSVVCFEYNTPYIVETTKMLKDLGVDIVTAKTAIEVEAYNKKTFTQDLHVTYAEEFAAAKALSDENFTFNLRTDFFEYSKDPKAVKRDFTYCYGCDFEVMLDADACLYPCMILWRNEKYRLGDLSKGKSFKDVWFSQERKDAMAKFVADHKNPVCDCKCKQFAIHPLLNKLKNPPLHVDVI